MSQSYGLPCIAISIHFSETTNTFPRVCTYPSLSNNGQKRRATLVGVRAEAGSSFTGKGIRAPSLKASRSTMRRSGCSRLRVQYPPPSFYIVSVSLILVFHTEPTLIRSSQPSFSLLRPITNTVALRTGNRASISRVSLGLMWVVEASTAYTVIWRLKELDDGYAVPKTCK